MNNDSLTPEFREKAKGKTAEEIVALAREEGIELSDEQLERVSGGWNGRECPNCGSMNVFDIFGSEDLTFVCKDCGYRW